MRNYFCLLIVSLFVFASIGWAQSVLTQDKQNLACSSINNLKISKAAKYLLLSRCKANVSAVSATAAGSKFTSVSSGKNMAGNDNSYDFGGCGHPTREFYFETGFNTYSDSDGAQSQGNFVFVDFKDYDCDGSLLSETTCYADVAPELVEVIPMKAVSAIVDIDFECSDGVTRHLTTNINTTASGFTHRYKSSNSRKLEDFNESDSYTAKDHFTDSPVGVIIFDGLNYNLNHADFNASWIGKWTAKFSHEDF